MSFITAVIGFLLGMSVGMSDTRTRMLKKLGDFAEARGLRLMDRDGNEVPFSELLEAARKR